MSDEDAALEAAVNEAISDAGGESNVVPDEDNVESTGQEVKQEAAEETPAEETKAEESAPEEEPLGLSAEQLAKINQNPELAAVYKSMQAGFTKKTTSLAEQRKELERKAQVADWLQNDPDRALAALAQARGKKFADEAPSPDKIKSEEAADEFLEEWAKTLNPNDLEAGRKAAQVFKPMLEKHIQALIGQYVTPMQQQQEELQRQAQERGLAAAVSEFASQVKSRGEAFDDEIKVEMAAKMDHLNPGENAKLDEYLLDLYNAVMYDRYRKGQIQGQLKRLQKAKTTSEPTAGARPAPKEGIKITGDMSEDEALAAAVAWAEQQAAG